MMLLQGMMRLHGMSCLLKHTAAQGLFFGSCGLNAVEVSALVAAHRCYPLPRRIWDGDWWQQLRPEAPARPGEWVRLRRFGALLRFDAHGIMAAAEAHSGDPLPGVKIFRLHSGLRSFERDAVVQAFTSCGGVRLSLMQLMRATRPDVPGSSFLKKLPPPALQLLVNFCTEPRVFLADSTVDVGIRFAPHRGVRRGHQHHGAALAV